MSAEKRRMLEEFAAAEQEKQRQEAAQLSEVQEWEKKMLAAIAAYKPGDPVFVVDSLGSYYTREAT